LIRFAKMSPEVSEHALGDVPLIEIDGELRGCDREGADEERDAMPSQRGETSSADCLVDEPPLHLDGNQREAGRQRDQHGQDELMSEATLSYVAIEPHPRRRHLGHTAVRGTGKGIGRCGARSAPSPTQARCR
jgi:hypothetical protein